MPTILQSDGAIEIREENTIRVTLEGGRIWHDSCRIRGERKSNVSCTVGKTSLLPQPFSDKKKSGVAGIKKRDGAGRGGGFEMIGKTCRTLMLLAIFHPPTFLSR